MRENELNKTLSGIIARSYIEFLVLDLLVITRIFNFLGIFASLIIIGLITIRAGEYGLKDFSFLKLIKEEGYKNSNIIFLALAILLGLSLVSSSLLLVLFSRSIYELSSFYIQDQIMKRALDGLERGEKLGKISPLARENTRYKLEKIYAIDASFEENLREKIEMERARVSFITNITHDIKTPLTSIINYTDILEKKEVMDEEAKAYIKILGRNSQRLKNLIVDMLEATKAASGNVKVEKNFIEFNELFLQIYGDFDDQFVKKSLELKYESDEENIYLYTDGNLLSRVISNLLSNINKYARENTNVEVKVKSGRELELSISNIAKEKLDIKEEDLQDAFVKIDKSRNTMGSGLGLYITKNLVHLLGGSFKLSLKDEIFTVEIKLKK
ncbi:histidine kinase A domain protein [Clostridiales bacterium KA00134]|nr:histidine kinase A domain protein [Clostridiales bacterium KA00134]